MKNSIKLMFSMILAVCLVCTNIPTNIIAAEIDFNNSETTEVLETQTGSNYYVKNNGNDDADGLSEANAWATLEKVNATTFQPGDSILLERGSVWNGQLWPKGSGNNTEGGYIRLGAYGTGNRPIINGNGTGAAKKEADNKNNPTNKQFISGAVMLVNQEYWVIENLEVTNSHKDYVSNKQGILVLNTAPTKSTAADANILNFIRIKNCYVHDVDALDITDWETPYQNYGSGERHNNTHKMTGGITTLAWNAELNGVYKNGILNEDRVLNKSAGFNDVIIENNHVLRVSKEGIRTKSTQFKELTGFNEIYPKKNSNVIIRNNYIEKVFGDAIVLSEVGSGGIVENNLINGHSFSDVANYAGVWTHYSDDALVQYNEVFNANNATPEGDGEGFDIDNDCKRNIVQYNYSHNNAGGFILYMSSQHGSGQWDSVTRYNISVNDAHKAGQDTFHYRAIKDDNQRPKIYNNTIYIDKNTTVTSLTTTARTNTPSMDFQNNIVLVHGTLEQLAGTSFSEDSIVRNNCFYPASIAYNKGLTERQLSTENNNIFVDPKLVNVSTASVREDDKYIIPVDKTNNPVFLSKETLRNRVAKYKLSNKSPEILRTGGIPILDTGVGSGSISGEFNYPTPVTEDIFGNPVNHTAGSKNMSIGAHQWTSADNNNEYIAPDNATVTEVTLDQTTLAMKVLDIKRLIATVTGDADLTDTSVSWSSSKPDVATVNGNGYIKAIKEGTTKITATSNRDNTKLAVCEVDVTIKKIVSYSPMTLRSYKGVKPPLPKTVTVKYDDESTEVISVKWNDVPSSDYNDTPVGSTYIVKGTTGTDFIPEITVTQIETGAITKVEMNASIDNYSQNGGTSTDNTKIRVKGSMSSGFGREGYIKFNLNSLGFDSTQANEAILRMYIGGIDFKNGYKASKFNVYVLDDTESKAFIDDEGTTIFAEIPSTRKVVNGMEVKYAATNASDMSNVPEYIDINVGDAVKYADSEGNITFKIKCEEAPQTTDINNSGIDFHSKNYGNGEKSPQLFVTNNYVTGISTIITPIDTEKGVAPVGMPETVDIIMKSMESEHILTSVTGRKVIWDTPTNEQLSMIGSFILYGDIEGTYIKAEQIVNVKSQNESLQQSIDDANAVLQNENAKAQDLVKSIYTLAQAIKEFK